MMNILPRIAIVLAVGGLMQATRSFAPAGLGHAEGSGVILAIGFALLASFFMGRIFSIFGLPKLTGYLATGVIAGPQALNYLSESMVGELGLVNGIAVALIALTAGGEMDFRSMKPLLSTIGWITLVAVVGTTVVLAGVAFAIRPFLPFMHDMTTMQAIAVATVVAVTIVAQSPAVVVAIRAETGADGPITRTILGVVVLADLVVIVMFAIVSAIANALLSGTANVGETAMQVAWELFGSLGVGVVFGILLSFYLRKVRHRVDLFVLCVCIVVAEVGQRLRFDPLLVMLAAGMFVENFSKASGPELIKNIESASLPVYIVFFTVAGASIHLDVIPTVAIPAAIFVVTRATGFLVGSRVAATIAGAPPEVGRFAGYGLLPQAGLAIALSLLFARTFPQFGEEASALTLGIVAINELVAPAFFRNALVRSGEGRADGDVAGDTEADITADEGPEPTTLDETPR